MRGSRKAGFLRIFLAVMSTLLCAATSPPQQADGALAPILQYTHLMRNISELTGSIPRRWRQRKDQIPDEPTNRKDELPN